ncbi:MAG TPA: DNA replication/repair protein RecF [Oscillatoriaceae cyanobacterium M33_DOE_052]|uniref:DNA replication and repair protein RecF n=1 Tax=Planktothricoides sp. SpSt-374 TaxID=2282167 RepID=A0A7C3ZVY1_9CYAN|nr:DNA replication/repair protein RecF [Oscillatoriaceae cyanobacterium M33_DOE_052]
MFLKTLHLSQFRNYTQQRVEFQAPKTILVGDNAQGKTNLLEAVALLSTLKSSRSGRDRELVMMGEAAGQITGYLQRHSDIKLSLTLRSNGRRTCAVNGENCRRQLDFLGILNTVQFSSFDLELVRGSPEQRRSWIDSVLVQLEPVYAHLLQQYHKVLRQRNALLKELRQSQGDKGSREVLGSENVHGQLVVWDAQLAATGVQVSRRRARALARLGPLAQTWHAAISGKTEVLDIHYLPNVEAMQEPAIRDDPQRGQQEFLAKLHSYAHIEQYQGSTVVGPHRDEIAFLLNQQSAKQYGSGGQQRTLVLALKLAELQLIETVVGEPPILLLDDVLAELDPNRQYQLFEAIQERFQTIITTTHLTGFDQNWLTDSQILTVKSGRIESGLGRRGDGETGGW